MKTLKLASNALLPTIQAYIIDHIDFDGYDLDFEPVTNDEKIKAFNSVFVSEYQYMIERVGQRKALTEYLMGLPSVLTVDFYYCDIYEQLKKWRVADGTETEKQYTNLMDQWFRTLSAKLSSMINNVK